MIEWSVAADDRTGALEVAGLLARSFGPVLVSVSSLSLVPGVVDIGSRSMSADDAARRAALVDRVPVRHAAHKIDSTLRGNWAVELRARAASSGRRVVLLPAWPEMGRTCRGGVVSVHGTPIGAVTDQLPEALVVGDLEALARWLSADVSGSRFVACDIADSAQMEAAGLLLAQSNCLVAGPAGPIAAALAARVSSVSGIEVCPPIEPTRTLVVCGSANPVSVEQVARLQAVAPQVRVLATPPAVDDLDRSVAERLAVRARSVLRADRPDTLLIIGGDTAAALLGDAQRSVHGMVAPGMPWSRDEHGGGPLVVTKAGGFGAPDTLVRVLLGETV